MSVLDKMRSGTDSTLVQLLLAGVLVSFIFFYGQPQGQQGQIVATVNGAAITDVEFARAFRDKQARAEAIYERSLSDAEVEELRQETRQDLIQQEVLRQEAERLGVEISDKELAQELLSIPSFRNAEGRFDEQQYLAVLRSRGYTRADFETEIRDALIREKLMAALFLGGGVNDPMLKHAWADSQTTVDVGYVRVAPMRFEDDVDVSPEALATFLAENKDRIQEAYNADFDRLYNLPERVRASEIRLPVRDDGVTVEQLKQRLESVRGQVEGGADFAEVARKWSESPTALAGGELGETPVAQLDAAVAEALAAVQPGQLTPVLQDEQQVRFYRLEERLPARQIPIEEVQDEIARRMLREEKSVDMAVAFAQELLAKWKETGAPPAELLQAQELQVQQTGPMPLRAPQQRVPSDLVGDAATAEAGAVLPEVYEQMGSYWVGQLTQREEPDLAELEQNLASLRDQQLLVERAELVGAWVQTLVSQAEVQ